MEHFSFNGFSYFSSFEEAVEQDLPDILKVNGNPSTEAILFRLLLGTLNFKYSQYEELYEQDIAYYKIREQFTEKRDGENTIAAWLDGELGIRDLEFYLKRNRRNKALFDELLAEFSLFFLCKNRKNPTTAFLHLYRALEYMSYSFPVSFSSRVVGFYTSFDTFKDFFINKDQGQLKFFREFINAYFDRSLLLCRTTIDTFVGEEVYDTNKRNVIKNLCREFQHHDDGYVIQIEYRYILDFMVTLRNRYFHFQYDRSDNISNINFDGELLFEALNDKFVNWLSMIYLEILTQGVYKLCLTPVK